MNLLKPLNVLHKPSNTVYKVIVQVNDLELVKVKHLDINRGGEQVDKVLDRLPFQDCMILQPSGKSDDEGRELMEGDRIVYDSDHRGEVYYDDKLTMWMVHDTEMDITRPLNNFSSSTIHKTGSKYGGINNALD